MAKLFYEGGSLFMGILTLLLLIIFCLAIAAGFKLSKGKRGVPAQVNYQLTYIREVALFALVIGILGQLIGLYSSFESVEFMKKVNPSLLAYGLRVSSNCSLYGFFIFVFAYLLWFGLNVWRKRMTIIK